MDTPVNEQPHVAIAPADLGALENYVEYAKDLLRQHPDWHSVRLKVDGTSEDVFICEVDRLVLENQEELPDYARDPGNVEPMVAVETPTAVLQLGEGQVGEIRATAHATSEDTLLEASQKAIAAMKETGATEAEVQDEQGNVIAVVRRRPMTTQELLFKLMIDWRWGRISGDRFRRVIDKAFPGNK